MRIISLLPAATEWIYAFGAGEQLVGRSHACNYPPEATGVPIVTRTTIEDTSDAGTVDRHVKDRVAQGLSLYTVDWAKIKELAPDLIITQDQCEVCAITRGELEEGLRARLPGRTELLSIAPQTLKEVLDGALRIGRAIDRLPAAMQFIAAAEKQLQACMDQLGVQPDGILRGRKRPSVMCLEWLEPLMAAGHWMPDVVEKAGGRALLGKKGEPSHYIDWEEVTRVDPDMLLIMPCGYSLDQTRTNLHYCTDRPGWTALRAVREQQVFVFNGSAYYNRPGPRLYRSIELLASALHPDRLPALSPPVRAWEFQQYTSLSSAPTR